MSGFNSVDADTEMRRHMQRTQEIEEQLLAPIAKRAQAIRQARYEQETSQAYRAWKQRKGNAHPCVLFDSGEESSAAYIFCDHNKDVWKNSMFLPGTEVLAIQIERRQCRENQHLPDISIRPPAVHPSVFRRTMSMAGSIPRAVRTLTRKLIPLIKATRVISCWNIKNRATKKQEKRKESL